MSERTEGTALSRVTLCSEAIQRVYRKAMVRRIRDALRTAYPSSWLEELKRPFTRDDWDKLVASVGRVRASGAVDALAQDEFDYLGPERFYNLVDLHFAVVLPDTAALPEPERSQAKSSILLRIKQIKDVRDPMAHSVDADFSFADAYTTMDAARRVLRYFDSAAAAEVDRLANELTDREHRQGAADDTKQRGELEGDLPPRESIAVAFVGRKSELADLQVWLDDPNARRWALAGEGGKGKTALAYAFAVIAKGDAPKQLQLLIWLSAKRRRYVEGATREIANPDFIDLSSALDVIVGAYAFDDAREWELPAKRLAALDLLNRIPALIVVDDIDAVEGQAEAAIEFFTNDVNRTPSKVLLTSRRVLFGLAASTTQIQGLSGVEADEFIDTRIRIMGLDATAFSRAVRSEVLLVTEGSPLYIEDLLRLCAIGVSPHEAVQRWRLSSGDEARKYALSREFEKLSRAARIVLLAAALNPVPVSLADLRLITNLADDVLLAAVAELQRLYLVPKPRLIEEVERFDLNLNVAALVRTATANTDEFREVQGAIAQLSQDVVARGRQRQDVVQYLRQGVGLARSGDQETAESVLQAGLKAHPNEADILGQLGWLYSKWRPRPRRTDARVFFKRAADMRCRQRDMYVHWADMEIKAGDYAAALVAASAGLSRHPDDPNILRREGYARTRIAADLRAQGAPSRAAEELELANKSLERSLTAGFDRDPESVRVRGTAYVSAIRNYELLQKPNLAVRLLRQWMAEDHDRAFYEERARFAAQHPDLEPQIRLLTVPKLA